MGVGFSRAVFWACCCSYCDIFYNTKETTYGYADVSPLIAFVPSPGDRVAVAESLNRDLSKVRERCDSLYMKLNECKTKTMIVCRSLTMYRQVPTLTLDMTVLTESDDI